MAQQLSLFDEFSLFEGIDVEFKGARGGLPRDLWETYSAFANSEGGTIWLGVSEKGAGVDPHGVPNAEKLVSDFWNTVNNRSKVSANLLKNSDVQIVRLDEPSRVLIRVTVPRANRRERPVFVGSDPFRGAYRRNHEGDYVCTEAEVRRMFADQSEEPADSRILATFTSDDLHPESLRQFRNRFASLRPGHAWLAEDDIGLLQKLGGWRRDRRTDEVGLTQAGLLMFGREQAIRDPCAIPGFHLDYRERFSEDPAVRWTDRLTLDGTWEGNLFQFYQLVTLKLSAGPGIKRPFQTDAEGYRVAGTMVDEALQEALVNALIHSDYAGQGGIVIDRYLDRLEFSNPGTLLLSREQLLRGGVSECRNKSLQLMFQMLGAGDKAGSGIDKIRSSWHAQHWKSPSLRETYRPDRVILELPLVSMIPDPVLRELERRFGDDLKKLEGDSLQVLVAALMEGEISNQRLQELLTLHRADITTMLRDLVKQGFLVASGLGRGTRYSLPVMPESDEGMIPHVGSISPHVGSLPDDVGSLASALIERNQVYALLDDADRGVLDQVLAGQVPRDVTRKAILILCRDRFLTARQLGDYLQRNPDGLRDRFLVEMVASGQLEQRFPDALRHRDQGYRTAEGRSVDSNS